MDNQNNIKKIKTYYSTEICKIEEEETNVDIFSAVGRQATKITVINDGPSKMFVKSYGSGKYPSKEKWIYPKHRITFNNVSKLLLGKTDIGNSYRISELDIIYDC